MSVNDTTYTASALADGSHQFIITDNTRSVVAYGHTPEQAERLARAVWARRTK